MRYSSGRGEKGGKKYNGKGGIEGRKEGRKEFRKTLHTQIGSPCCGEGANHLTALELVAVELGLTCKVFGTSAIMLCVLLPSTATTIADSYGTRGVGN